MGGKCVTIHNQPFITLVRFFICHLSSTDCLFLSDTDLKYLYDSDFITKSDRRWSKKRVTLVMKQESKQTKTKQKRKTKQQQRQSHKAMEGSKH